jgi:hypothetical protein
VINNVPRVNHHHLRNQRAQHERDRQARTEQNENDPPVQPRR